MISAYEIYIFNQPHIWESYPGPLDDLLTIIQLLLSRFNVKTVSLGWGIPIWYIYEFLNTALSLWI